ncbi:hypothetical protein M0805_005679 [Coniferiporia weirii]|nr:hypothetical protein M0805_005679 [Coniferiporia weirii]
MQSFFFPSRNNTYDLGGASQLEGHLKSLALRPGTGGPKFRTIIVSVYFFLQIFGGHFGVPIILITLLTKKDMQRHPLLINFLVTWVLYATAFCLLLYVGQQFGPEPPVSLCLSQASLIYGAAVMCSMAGLAFVVNLWLGINSLNGSLSSLKAQRWRNYILITSPYIFFVLFTIITAVVGSAYPAVVTRDQYYFYCTINLEFVDLVPGCSGLILLCVLVFEILIAIKLYRMHKAFIHVNSRSGPPLNLVLRVVIFSIYSILSLLACMGFWSQQGDEAPYIIQASLPTAAFLIFGSQREFLNTWGITSLWYWLRRKPLPMKTTKSLPPTPSDVLMNNSVG